MTGRWAAALAASLALLTALGASGCGDSGAADLPEEQVAALCDGLQSSLPVARRAAMQDATELMEDAGDDEAVFAALEETCPSALADALAGELTGGEDESALRGDVSLELDRCAARAAEGTVANDGDATVTVTIRAEFTDRDEVLLRESTDRVTIRPGQAGRFSVPFLAAGDDYARCAVEIDRVTRQ